MATRFIAIGVLALAILAARATAQPPADEGFEVLYQSAATDEPLTCQGAVNLPPWLSGSFILPTVGQFEVGAMSFQGILDGFGKLNRFDIRKGQVCFTARMMDTGFYNDSIALQKVAPAVLFEQTAPPSQFSGAQMVGGHNDNNYVNTIALPTVDNSSQFFLVSDTQVYLTLDPNTLTIQSRLNFTDKLDRLVLPLGSAHPQYVQGGACILNVDAQSDMLGLTHKVLLYKLCGADPAARTLVNSYAAATQVYLHSWGLTQRFAVIPHQHFTISMMNVVIWAETLSSAFQTDSLVPTDIYLMPLDGTAPIKFTLPTTRLFYTHFVNAYETADSVVFDLCTYEKNPFLPSPLSSVPEARNGATRNDKSKFSQGVVTRVELFVSGARQGQSVVTPLTDAGKSTDFPNVNPNFKSRAYCYFYAVEWFHDTLLLGSMAISKQPLCGGSGALASPLPAPVYWYEPGMFPSEPTFLPTPGGTAEDDGVLLFSATHGATKQSFLIVVNAATMVEIERVPLPQTITFSTHGEFFKSL